MAGRVDIPPGTTPGPLEHEAGGTRGRLGLDEQLRFELKVPCGPVVLRGWLEGGRQVLWEGTAPAADVVLKLPGQLPGRVEVHVRDARGPVRGAEVTAAQAATRPVMGRPLLSAPAQPAWSPSGLTDAEGVAVLPGLRPGTWSLQVSSKGHSPFEAPRGIQVVGGVTRVDVQLEPGVQLEGRVLDERGRAVTGVHAEATPRFADSPVPGRPSIAPVDAAGRFRFRDLQAAARYALEAHPNGDWVSPGPVEVVPGEGPVVVRLHSPPWAWGRAVGWNGRPLNTFELDGELVVGTGGRFRFKVDPQAPPELSALGHLHLTLTVPRLGGNLGDVQLRRAPVSRGTVQDEAGRPLRRALVMAGDCGEETRTDAEGRFEIASTCTTLLARQGARRGVLARGGEGEGLVLVARGPSRLRARAFGEAGTPDARSLWNLSCEPSLEDVREELRADKEGRLEVNVYEGVCTLSRESGDTDLVPALSTTFRAGPGLGELALGHAPGTSAVTFEVPAGVVSLHVITEPPSDRTWSAHAWRRKTVVVTGLPPGRYGVSWLRLRGERAAGPLSIDVPAVGPVRPP